MIYIAVALGAEGKKIIDYYGLKRDNSIKKFQVFKNDRITLVITGVGMLNALAGTVFLLTPGCEKSDILLNIGVCGTKNREKYSIGDVVLANKVIDRNNGVIFYPDMVFNHPFKEGTLETFSHVVGENEKILGEIVDMEGAGVAKGGSIFLDTSRIYMLKIVSDYLDGDVEDIGKIISEGMEKIDSWIGKIENFQVEEEVLKQEDLNKIESFAEKMRFTTTMTNEFKSLMEYYVICGNPIDEIIDEYKNIEIVRKNEVKKIFDEIRRKVAK